MNRPRKNQTSTLHFASYAIASAMSLSLVACAGGNGLVSKNGADSATSALDKASGGLKIEKINGINVITKASIEAYLYDLKNNAESQAAKSFETIKESNAVEFAKQSWSDATNEPLDVMGYRFENLGDWGTALEEQVELSMGGFSTMSDYFKSGGIESTNDIMLESINDSLLAAEEFFAQDPVAWAQKNQGRNQEVALSLQDKMLVPQGISDCEKARPGKNRGGGVSDGGVSDGGFGGTWMALPPTTVDKSTVTSGGRAFPHIIPYGLRPPKGGIPNGHGPAEVPGLDPQIGSEGLSGDKSIISDFKNPDPCGLLM